MSDTLSQAITAAMKATLQKYGPNYGLPEIANDGVFWYETDQQILPSQCPSLGVLDRGWRKAAPATNGGLTSTGQVLAGIQQRTYTFELLVHLVGAILNPDATVSDMKRWLDGIAACVDDHCQLDIQCGYAEAEAGDPTEPFALEGQSFVAGQVTVIFHSWSRDGSVEP